jgi:RimJ/RimL family protein N-acetyltransferase
VYVPVYPKIDEQKISIRPIRADDGDRLRASHARLSPESRYRRFLASKPELSSADAQYLADIDGCSHFALVATLDDPEGSIIAVARFVSIPDAPGTAEFAIVVGDDYQGKGLATELLTQLAEAAAERGVHRFRATMFADNVPVRRMLHRLAVGDPREARMGSTSEIEIDLPGAPANPIIRVRRGLTGVRRGITGARRGLSASGNFAAGVLTPLRSLSGAGRRLRPRRRLHPQSR